MIGLNHLNISYFAITREVPVENIQGKTPILQFGLSHLKGDTLVKLWVVLIPDSVDAGSLRLVVGAQGHLVGCGTCLVGCPNVRVRRAVKEAEPCVVSVREVLAIQQNHLESDHGLGDCTAVCLRSKDNVGVQDVNHETDRRRANMFAFALFRLLCRLPCFAKCLSVRMRYLSL